jgi:ribonuclease P protein component
MKDEGPSAPPGDDLGRAAKDDPGKVSRETFPRRLRLQRRREFLRVQRSGAKHHTRFFLVFVAPSALRGRGPALLAPGVPTGEAQSKPSGLPPTRLGVTVTRKVGKAVKRNRIKRLVREAFRREHHALPAGLDMVWVAKRDAVDSTFEAVVHDMRALAGRLETSPHRRAPNHSATRSATSPRSR